MYKRTYNIQALAIAFFSPAARREMPVESNLDKQVKMQIEKDLLEGDVDMEDDVNVVWPSRDLFKKIRKKEFGMFLNNKKRNLKEVSAIKLSFLTYL